MNQKSFRLNYCVDEDTHDGALAKYLEQHRLSKKQVMLEAIRMYWMPLALKEAGVSGEQLEETAWEAVFTLQKQINYICAVLDLDRSKLGGTYQHSAQPVVNLKAESDEVKEKTPEEKKKELLEKMRISKSPTTGYSAGTGFEDWD